MSNTHQHQSRDYGRAFAVGIALNLAFVIAEFIFGRIAHSLALVADAGHNFTDILSLILAWGAMHLSRRTPTAGRTFGMRRSSILASLINAVILLVALGAITWEAIQRFSEPQVVSSTTVVAVAAMGIAINSVTTIMFAKGRQGDVNIRGAFLHMTADAAVSAGVVVTGILIMITGWLWLDPLVSLLIVAVIVAGTWSLLRESMNLALDAVPEGISVEDIQNYLSNIPTVLDVHDLHIWAISTTEAALTAHLVVPQNQCDDEFLIRVEDNLHNRFGIEHSTLQVESGNAPYPCRCRLSPALRTEEK